ncbi:HRH1 [Lepeophtheirus salmonis]|uniref:HRH1 n=1 Tax=Lepeophtheirus salmonis TaxID=72036 RepID=A0A7R8H4S9_LEPSM|nr:HRH1 [Lepeophtheirus salmonis]CAF2853464.1 HRH1 [Lepeophtheirus salmonis]
MMRRPFATLSTLIPTGLGLYIFSFTTFVGNAMVLHAIRTEKRLQTVSNMFIMSLASADLTVGLIVMPISSAYALTGDWKFGYVVCQFWLVIDYTASTASIFNLCILSLDRYWSISTPLQYLRKRTKKRALIMIGLAWLASAMWFIPVLGWHHILYNGKRQQPEGVCDTEFATNITFKLSMYEYFLAIRRRSEDIERLGATTSGMAQSSTPITTNIVAAMQDDMTCDSLTEHDHVESNYCQGPQNNLLINVEYVNNASSSNNQDAEDSSKKNKADKSTTAIIPTIVNATDLQGNVYQLRLQIELTTKNNSKTSSTVVNSNNNLLINGVSATPSSSFSDEDEQDVSVRINTSVDQGNGWIRTLFCPNGGGSGKQRSDLFLQPQCSTSNLTPANPKTVLAKEKKAATQLGVIVGAFILCWLPYFTLFMVVAYCGEANQCVSSTVHTVTIWFGYFNSTLKSYPIPSL